MLSRKHCLIWPGFLVRQLFTVPHWRKDICDGTFQGPRGLHEPASTDLSSFKNLHTEPFQTKQSNCRIFTTNNDSKITTKRKPAGSICSVSPTKTQVSEQREGLHPILSKRGRVYVYIVLVCKYEGVHSTL